MVASCEQNSLLLFDSATLDVTIQARLYVDSIHGYIDINIGIGSSEWDNMGISDINSKSNDVTSLLVTPPTCYTVTHLKTSRAWPPSGEVSRKKGTTRDRLALRRDGPVPPALSKPPARVRAVLCFFKNFSSGFIPAGMVCVCGGGCVCSGGGGWGAGIASTSQPGGQAGQVGQVRWSQGRRNRIGGSSSWTQRRAAPWGGAATERQSVRPSVRRRSGTPSVRQNHSPTFRMSVHGEAARRF